MIVGASGKAGCAISQLMEQRGHDLITVSRSTGDVRCDISDEQQRLRCGTGSGRSMPWSAQQER